MPCSEAKPAPYVPDTGRANKKIEVDMQNYNIKTLQTYELYGREESYYAPLELFATDDSAHGWDIYYSAKADADPYTGCLLSIAKPGSGGEGTYFGDLNHVRYLMRNGWWHLEFTPLGRKLMGLA